MVWIEIYTGDGIINDERIERIYARTPKRHKDNFEFCAEVNGKPWLIYSENLPHKIVESVTKEAKENPKYEDYHEGQKAIHEAFLDHLSEICDREDEIFSKITSILLEAKKIDNNQIINFSESLSREDSSE
jgi:hypothetical protein